VQLPINQFNGGLTLDKLETLIKSEYNTVVNGDALKPESNDTTEKRKAEPELTNIKVVNQGNTESHKTTKALVSQHHNQSNNKLITLKFVLFAACWIIIGILVYTLFSSSQKTEHSAKLLVNPVINENYTNIIDEPATNVITGHTSDVNDNPPTSQNRQRLKRRGFSSPYNVTDTQFSLSDKIEVPPGYARSSLKTTDEQREERYIRVQERRMIKHERESRRRKNH
jgi:hypothetical protein